MPWRAYTPAVFSLIETLDIPVTVISQNSRDLSPDFAILLLDTVITRCHHYSCLSGCWGGQLAVINLQANLGERVFFWQEKKRMRGFWCWGLWRLCGSTQLNRNCAQGSQSKPIRNHTLYLEASSLCSLWSWGVFISYIIYSSHGGILQIPWWEGLGKLSGCLGCSSTWGEGGSSVWGPVS